MVADPQHLYMTEEQYLAFDRASEVRNEYWDGKIVALSGGKSEHTRYANLRIPRLLGEEEDN